MCIYIYISYDNVSIKRLDQMVNHGLPSKNNQNLWFSEGFTNTWDQTMGVLNINGMDYVHAYICIYIIYSYIYIYIYIYIMYICMNTCTYIRIYIYI